MRTLGPLVELAELLLDPFDHGANGLGPGHVGHFELVFEAELVGVEAGLHVVDRAAVLDRDDAPGREAASVADPVDLVEDGDARVARAQEVRVQRVHASVVDGTTRRHEGLGRDLAAEGPLAVFLRVLATVRVDFNGFEVEQIDKEFKGFGHASIVAPVSRTAPRGAK